MIQFASRYVIRLLAIAVLAMIGWGNAFLPAQAHTSTVGYSDIFVSGSTIEYELYLNPEEVAQWKDTRSKGVFVIEAAPSAQSTSGNQVKWTQDDLKPLIQASLTVKSSGTPALPSISDISIKERGGMSLLYMKLKYSYPKPVESYEINYSFFFNDLDPMHQSFTTIKAGNNTINTVFDKNHRIESDRIEGMASAPMNDGKTMPGWLMMGMEHIWTGIDHLLFIAALVLLRQKKREYLKILTAFTVGHSITIALAALELVTLPARIVEPVIALSIVYVAIENLWRKKLKWRWLAALLFGFIHGFGFAQVLRGALGEHYLLSLFGFNLGVEIGQIAVLAVLLPLLMLSVRLSWHRQAVFTASGVIALTGVYWFIERIV